MKLHSLISESRVAAAEAFYRKRCPESREAPEKILRQMKRLEKKVARPIPPFRGKDSHKFETLVESEILPMLSYLTPLPTQDIVSRVRSSIPISEKRIILILKKMRAKKKILGKRAPGRGRTFLWRLSDANPAS